MLSQSLLHSGQRIPGKTNAAVQEYWLHQKPRLYMEDRRNSTSVQNATKHGRNTSARGAGYALHRFPP